MGRGTSICFYHSLRACVPFISCVELCVELYLLFATFMWDVDLVRFILVVTWYQLLSIGWINCDVRCALELPFILTPRYACYLKDQPLHIMSHRFANDFVTYISCLNYLWHPPPICGLPLICATCLICTHLGGDAICHMILSIYFANPSVVI